MGSSQKQAKTMSKALTADELVSRLFVPPAERPAFEGRVRELVERNEALAKETEASRATRPE